MSRDLRLSRRNLLLGLGASAALLPVLGAPRTARADARAPLNLIILTWSNGVNLKLDAQAPEVFVPPDGSLRAAASGLIPAVTAPLFAAENAPLLDSVLVPRGVQNLAAAGSGLGNGHDGYLTLLSGTKAAFAPGGSARSAGGASLDQVVAGRIGHDTPFPSLQLGVCTGSNATPPMFPWWNGLDAPFGSEDSPHAVFDLLFGRVGAEDEMKRTRLRKKSVIDPVMSELGAFASTLSREDRARVEQHLDGLRQIEKTLAVVPDPSCRGDLDPAAFPFDEHQARQGYGDPLLWSTLAPEISKVQLELGRLALACGLTRVIGVQYENSAGDLHNIAPSNGFGIETGGRTCNVHYDLAHGGAGAKDGEADNPRFHIKNAFDAWHVAETMRFVRSLRETQAPGGGTLLDQSVVMLINGFGGGGGFHATSPLPIVIAGGGGRLRTGSTVDCSKYSMNQLAASLANAVGADLDTFGDPRFGQGTIPELLA